MRIILAILIASAVILSQVGYGGILRVIFSMPSYALLAVAGLLGGTIFFWRRAVSPDGWAVASVVALGGYLVWRSWNSTGQDLQVFYTFLVLGCGVVYLLTAAGLTTPASRYVLVSLLFAAAMGQCFVAALQFTSEGSFFPQPWISEQMRAWFGKPVVAGVQRAHGSFISGNQLSWMLNATAFFGFGLAVFGRCPIWAKILFAYVGGMCALGVLLTLSRGGVVGLLAGSLTLIALLLPGLVVGARDRRIPFALITIVAAVAVFGGAFVFFRESGTVQARMARLTEDSYRIELWKAVVRQSQVEPLLGTGAGSFTNKSRRLTGVRDTANDLYAHNDWAQMLADYGLLGLVLLSLALVANMRAGLSGLVRALRERMASSSRPQSNSVAFSAGAICAVAAGVAHSFFDYNMQIPANAFLMSLCVGLLANSGLPSLKKTSGGRWIRRFASVAALGGGLTLGYLLVRLAPVEVEALRAENAMLGGDPFRAAGIATNALREEPSHSRLRRFAAEASLRSNDAAALVPPQVAIEHLREAVRLDPDERWNHLLLAMALSRTGDYESAEREHVEAIRLDPGSPTMHEFRALTLEQSGRAEAAIRAYQVSLQLPGCTFANERLRNLSTSKGSPQAQ